MKVRKIIKYFGFLPLLLLLLPLENNVSNKVRCQVTVYVHEYDEALNEIPQKDFPIEHQKKQGKVFHYSDPTNECGESYFDINDYPSEVYQFRGNNPLYFGYEEEKAIVEGPLMVRISVVKNTTLKIWENRIQLYQQLKQFDKANELMDSIKRAFPAFNQIPEFDKLKELDSLNKVQLAPELSRPNPWNDNFDTYPDLKSKLDLSKNSHLGNGGN